MRRAAAIASGALIVLGALTSGVIPAAAQGGHKLGEAVLPLAPDPRRCKVAPRPLGQVKSLWQAANADPAANAAPAPDQNATGTPVDPDTLTAISDAVVQQLACSANANDGLRDAALSTDARLSDMLIGLSQDGFANYYTANPTASQPEDWTMLYALNDVRALPDGRVAVAPQVIAPGVGQFQGFMIFAPGPDGSWLLDASVEGDTNLYPDSNRGVPAP
jgi:hypothetical protein